MGRVRYLVLSMFLAPSVLAQKHVHDEGLLFVVQEDSQWQFQFVIPAFNAFGFEHMPESQQDVQKIKEFVKSIGNADSVLTLANGCSLQSQSESVTETYLANIDKITNGHHEHDHEKHDHDEHDHEKHDHDKHDHEKHDHHEHDHEKHDHDEHDHDEHNHNHNHDHGSHEATHSDAEFEYLFTCTEAPQQVEVKVFDVLSGLSNISIQWATQTGQGSTSMPRTDRLLRLSR